LDESMSAHSLLGPRVNIQNDGKLVHLIAEDPAIAQNGILEDGAFGMSFPVAGELERVTEYCQWEEHRRVETVVVGQTADSCMESDEAPNNPDCSGPNAVACGDMGSNACRNERDCCVFVPGEDEIEERTSFEYFKAWRPQRINSLLFDNALSYHNPQRDPMPGYARMANVVTLGDGRGADTAILKASVSDIADGLLPIAHVPISQKDAEGVRQKALDAGFAEADHMYFYSRTQADGTLMSAAKVAGSYLLEGVADVSAVSAGTGFDSLLGSLGLDWITKGTCAAGDIRVSFAQRAVPQQLSVVGEQRQGFIAPHLYGNGEKSMLARPGVLPLDALLGDISKSAGRAAWWPRLGAVFLMCIGCFFGGDFMLTGAAVPLKVVLPAVVLVFAGLGMIWGVLYGPASALYPLLLGVGIPVGLGFATGGKWFAGNSCEEKEV